MISGIEYKKILKKLPFGYALHKIILDAKGVPIDYEYIEVNEAFETFIGLEKKDIIGKKITELFPSMDNSDLELIKRYGNVAINNLEVEFEQSSKKMKKWYKVQAYSPKKYYFIAYYIDVANQITEREVFKSILVSITEGIIATDLSGRIKIINETAELITGFKENELPDGNILEIIGICDGSGKDIFDFINKGGVLKERKNIIKSKAGIEVPIEYSISPVKDSNGDIYGIVISFKDITEKISKDKELDYVTYHDSLTGAYNRTFFNNQIENIDKVDSYPLSVIMGDVNGLKLINDAFGHLMGDRLLKSAADIMKKICRKSDLLVRWGGDEFIILLPKTPYEDVAQISERIKEECLKENIELLNISISLGYDTKKDKDEDIMKIVTNAEEMMYKVKMLESKSTKSRTLKLIINTLYEKSEEDGLHSKNTRKICRLIGEAIGMTKEKISELEILGEIHDIGKVAISKDILNKPGKLNEAEWEEMKKHPQIGYHIVSSSSDIAFLAESVLAHHERYDGTGYPKGLKSDEIPLMARILSIADAYETEVNSRKYREKLKKEEAIAELLKNSGSHFDPRLVRIFIDKVIDKL
ncbi:diguanylate cyclase [Clostridium saccharoperbutylacetonicum]|uniref:diguanylate cyclase n=1 Tax=Clostridium saccharoperbutylacetonicum TaxID=36745 RepID=UPI0039E8B2F3